jgi:hypothetical protein
MKSKITHVRTVYTLTKKETAALRRNIRSGNPEPLKGIFKAGATLVDISPTGDTVAIEAVDLNAAWKAGPALEALTR